LHVSLRKRAFWVRFWKPMPVSAWSTPTLATGAPWPRGYLATPGATSPWAVGHQQLPPTGTNSPR
jgi:hypothetical protein